MLCYDFWALFLDPDRPFTIVKLVKSLVRLIAAFVFWNVIYQFYYIISGTYNGLNWKGVFSQTLEGPYHFWFLFMLCGVYLITPFLRLITKDKRLMEYFLILFLLFEFLTNYGVRLPFIGSTLSVVLRKVNFHFALGYSGYFVAGYYFHKYAVSDKLEGALYILGAFLWIGAAVATVKYSAHISDLLTLYLTPNVAIESFALYTFFVKRVSKVNFKPFIRKMISQLSEYSFGIYLVHALVLEFMGKMGLSPVAASPLIMVPAIAVVGIAVGGLIVYVVRMIPYLGKKIT